MTSKIIKSTWFSTMNSTHQIGVILCFDSTIDKFQAYIGIGTGVDEPDDEERIHQWGSKLTKELAIAYFEDAVYRKEDFHVTTKQFRISTDYKA